MAALSRATVPGRLDRTIGNDTGDPALRRSAFKTFSTPRRISALVELPSRAARDFSRRYSPSGMSTVVRMSALCHIYGVEESNAVAPTSTSPGFQTGRRPHVSRNSASRLTRIGSANANPNSTRRDMERRIVREQWRRAPSRGCRPAGQRARVGPAWRDSRHRLGALAPPTHRRWRVAHAQRTPTGLRCARCGCDRRRKMHASCA